MRWERTKGPFFEGAVCEADWGSVFLGKGNSLRLFEPPPSKREARGHEGTATGGKDAEPMMLPAANDVMLRINDVGYAQRCLLRKTDYPSVTCGDTSPDKGGAMGALPGADEAT